MELAVEVGTFNANFFVFDYRSIATVYLARALWLRGFSDQALRIVRRPSVTRRTEVTQFRSAFRWVMTRRFYCGSVIC